MALGRVGALDRAACRKAAEGTFLARAHGCRPHRPLRAHRPRRDRTRPVQGHGRGGCGLRIAPFEASSVVVSRDWCSEGPDRPALRAWGRAVADGIGSPCRRPDVARRRRGARVRPRRDDAARHRARLHREGHQARLRVPHLARRVPARPAERAPAPSPSRRGSSSRTRHSSRRGARSRRARFIFVSTGSSAAACTRTTRSPTTRALLSSSTSRFMSSAISPTCSTCASTRAAAGASCRAPGTSRLSSSSPRTGTGRSSGRSSWPWNDLTRRPSSRTDR